MLPRAPGARWAATLALSGVLGLGLLTAGCGAGLPIEDPSPSPVPPSVTAGPRVPPDGVALAVLGFTYGPGQALSVPRSALITDRVDQPNAVTVVFGTPTPTEIAAYYRRTLPATGFRIIEDAGGETLTFAGYGWRGALTGADATSAISLRPE